MSGPSLSAIQPGSGVPQVSRATNKVKANWISAIAQPCARCRGKTNKVHPYCRLAIMSMHTTPRVRWRQRALLRCRLSDLGASIVVIAEPSGYLSPGNVTAGIGPLLFNALGHVARYGTRAARRAPGLSLDEGEGHFEAAPVGHGSTAGSFPCRLHRSRHRRSGRGSIQPAKTRLPRETCLVAHAFCAMPLCGLRLPMWPLSVPVVGSIAQLIRAGFPEANASVSAFASPWGSTA